MKNTYFKTQNLSNLKREDFQKEIDGSMTDLFILTNNNGMEVSLTNYGCMLLSIMVPDKNGNYENVILGHSHIDDILNCPEPFLNTVVGRYANRIAKGKFSLDNKEYQLTINNGPNALHGGPTGFHTKVWVANQIAVNKIELTYTSDNGEEGYPGNLEVKLTYSLSNETNALHINYKATTDQKTLVNLTSHGFFNLAGIGTPTCSVENNIVSINANHYLPIDEVSIPTGEILKVEGTPMDFRKPSSIGLNINQESEQLKNGAGYDHCYVLNKKEPGELSLAATCLEPNSKRKMTVYTTEPGVQLYTGNWLNGFEGAHGATFPARSAVCFEAQRFPDTPNKSHFPTAILNPKEEYNQTTIYEFTVEEVI